MAAEVGQRIRVLRRQRGMDVTALARAAHLSRGYLSHVESGAAVPSVPALERIGEVLGVPVAAFFDDATSGARGRPGFDPSAGPANASVQQEDAIPVSSTNALQADVARHAHGIPVLPVVADARIVRADERRSVMWATRPNHRYELLVPDLNRAIEVMLLIVTPPDTAPRKGHGHYGESFVLVLEGSFGITLEDATQLLGTGDAIYFPNTMRHGLYLAGDEPGRALWVQSPPYF